MFANFKKAAAVMVLPFALMAASSAWADDQAGAELTYDEFLVQTAQIEKDLDSGQRYAKLDKTKKSELRELLMRMDSRLTGHVSSSELSDDEQVRLFNEQERVNTLLGVNSERERVVCRRERKTGSNRTSNVCRTTAEIERERERTLHDLRHVRTGIGAPNG